MDGEPGFAEPGGRIKTGQGKNNKTHWSHQQRGTVFFGYFLCLYKESTSFPVGTKKGLIFYSPSCRFNGIDITLNGCRK